MIIWLKHLLGLCRRPEGWHEFIKQKRKAAPGKIIWVTEELLQFKKILFDKQKKIVKI